MQINQAASDQFNSLTPAEQQKLATDLGFSADQTTNAWFALQSGDPKAQSYLQKITSANAPAPTPAPAPAPPANTALGANSLTTGGLPLYKLVTSPSGSKAYLNTQTGQYYNQSPGGALSVIPQAQAQAAGFQNVAGFDSAGNPIFTDQQSTAQQQALQTAEQNAVTPAAAAYLDASATDPGLAQSIKQLQSYYNQNQALTSGAQATTATGAPTGAVGAPNPVTGGQNVANLEKTYLNQQDVLDPTYAATRNATASSYLNDLNAANSGNLPSGVSNEVAQGARAAQTARGNALGTSQAAQEAMSQGLTGLQIKQQAQQNAQSWLSSGLSSGKEAAALYDWQTGLKNQSAGNLTSYLNSGQTPYSVGTSNLANIQNQANSANQTTQYSPQSIGNPYSYLNPNAGTTFSNGANQWYNSMTGSALGSASLANSAGPSPAAGAATGALGGATAGAALGPYGALAGAIIGGVGGGLSASCYVAREVFGQLNPQWVEFRDYLYSKANPEFKNFYEANAPKIATMIHTQPEVKQLIKYLMKELI